MYSISRGVIGKAVAIIAAVILLLAFLQVRSCSQARQKAAQSKLDKGQAGAAQESAKDAIATQGEVTTFQSKSEDLARANEKEIRDAKGADAAVDPAVRDAGLASLCRRASYRDTEQCRVRRTPPR